MGCKKCVCLLGLFLLLLPVGVWAQVTAIKAGRLVDPETGTSLTNQVILVEGGKIKALGSDIGVPPGATLVDLSNAMVLPGLMDVHTHLCFPPIQLSGVLIVNKTIPMRWETAIGLKAFALGAMMNPTGYRAIQGVANARAMLEAGFTTVRDLGHGGNYADTDLRRAIEEGLVMGPTIMNSGRKIAAYGGQFQLEPERRDLGEPDYIYADTRDEMRRAVRENIHYGAKVIKIVVAGQPYIYSADDIRFIVEEAARSGLKVAADCATRQASRNAAEAGLASIEHAVGMTEEDLAIARKNGVALVMNVPPEKIWREFGIPLDTRKPYVEQLRRAYQAGVTLAFGTDVVFAMPGETHGTLALEYLESDLDAGIPPKVILQMMTSNAARLLGIEKERGTIRPGMAADIIATTENPLETIRTLKHVRFIMKDGKIIRNELGHAPNGR